MAWHYERNVELEAEFNVLSTLMADMITAQAQMGYRDANAPAWMLDLHHLSLKLFKHMRSARALLEPCEFSTASLPARCYIDHSSLAVVVRSSIENYLVLHWLHGNGDEAVRTFRHNAWVYGGWKKRSKFFASMEEAREGKQRAIEDAAALLCLIEASPIYQSYHPEQKKKLRKGDWQAGAHWNQLAEDAGLHRTYFASIYPYTSGYAHSDYISSLQVGQAEDLQTQYQLALTSIQVSMMIMGHFTLFYANLFPAAKGVLDGSGDAKALVGKWSFKAEDMDSFYSQDDSDQ